MINRSIGVFGRIKPAVANSQIKDYNVQEGIHNDVVKFINGKYTSGRRSFRFKKVFRPEGSSQEDIFEHAAKPILENFLTGYNGTIFAYGQTGTGKTYTMTGDFTEYKERGIIPRTIQFLFNNLKETSSVAISYFEIYNEHGYDLIGFQPTTTATLELQQVNVLEDSRGNLHFRNLSSHNVKSVQEALDLLLFGDGNRMVAETMNNLRSSRSHTIFLVTVETLDPENKTSIRSTLHLVDLAGSERLGKSGSLTANSWESRYINLSLHYLEQVLVALGEPGRIHIPYRNSLMTTVLKNSLGGNCCTAMIATFSCEAKDFEETLQTCRFSQRVALVRNDAKINEVMDINQELILLRRENAYLKNQIEEMQLQQFGESMNQELTESDKMECYERVKDFIADSQFMNLPLSNTKKAEYCFILMRNEIVKLKLSSNSQDYYKDLTDWVEGGPSIRNDIKLESNNMWEVARKESSKKKVDPTLRKRRVVMDIPKVNVIYKKYKSTESIYHEEFPQSEKFAAQNENAVKKADDRGNHRCRISQSSQTSNTLLKKEVNAKLVIESSAAAFLENTKKFEDVLELEIKEVKKEVMEKLPDSKGNTDLGDRESSSGGMSWIADEKSFEEEDYLRDVRLSISESDQMSGFSTTDLPLTGDAEVDEEIIKFYKARYRKFKSND